MQSMTVKPFIAAIEPYVAGKPVEETAREYGLDPENIVKLASNENPLGMPPSALKAIHGAAAHIERYPDGNARLFREAVAKHFGVDPDWVIAGNGSDEILGLVARVRLAPGVSCVYSQYSFSVYELSARENGATCIEVPAKNFAVDLEGMLAAVNETTRLVFITNPNNPTGLALSAGAVEHFIRSVPEECLVVLDEAYIDYMPEADRVDSVGLLGRYPNLMITRTFSKAYGLAGLRAGFAIARPELIEMMNRIRPPFNMNILAQAAAAGCIDDAAFLKTVYDTNRAGVQTLEKFFEEKKLMFLPTQANFILVHVGPKAKQVNTELLKQGVIVRPLTSYGLPEHLRISVGSAAQNARFMEAFDEAIRRLGGL